MAHLPWRESGPAGRLHNPEMVLTARNLIPLRRGAMPDETFRQLGPLLTQEERSALIDIEITLGCATCLGDGPPTGAIREALRQASDPGLDWKRIYEVVRTTFSSRHCGAAGTPSVVKHQPGSRALNRLGRRHQRQDVGLRRRHPGEAVDELRAAACPSDTAWSGAHPPRSRRCHSALPRRCTR
jgi:hypothetical protein